jgi:hypothetical protein
MRAALLCLATVIASSASSPSAAQVHGYAAVLRRLDDVIAELEHATRESCDPKLADKAEDAVAKLESAADELTKNPPDSQAAAGGIEGAVGDLEAAVADECLDVETGVGLMDDLAGVTRRLATRSLDVAEERGGKRGEIRDAVRALDEGDRERDRGRRGDLAAFKRAAAKYKDALAKGESARG